MPNQFNKIFQRGLLLLALATFWGGNPINALNPQEYASVSVLSQGSWAKVEIQETGMQFISDVTLRGLGFPNPENVNIYGYGGVVIPESLESPDDLPMVPSIRINGGILFFGRGPVGWKRNNNETSTYSHDSHPYSDKAFYFISDVNPERLAPELAKEFSASGETITYFTERLLHEQDLFMPINTGRLMLGEDFRTTSTRSFQFQLVGNTGDAKVITSFACKTGATSSLQFSANGVQLPSSSSDQMVASDSKLVVSTKTIKEVEMPGTMLDLTIKFNGNGGVSSAGLDYIEVEYPRALSMVGGELYFYINPLSPSLVKIEKASSTTILWDVSDPQNPLQVVTDLNGSTLSFVSDEGYHEYIAFEPNRISHSVNAGVRVENQDLHSMNAPDMILISPVEYIPAAQRLVDLHKQTDGLEVAIVTPEEVYNEFSSGKPDVSAFRKMMKMWYDRANGESGKYPAYCLIMSRPTYDNKLVTAAVRNSGYPRVPIWQSPTGETATTSYSTDDYIGMLQDQEGVFNIATAVINVAVGRMPVKSLAEAHTAIDKLENFILNPDLGAWKNNVMVIADDQDGGVHLDQAERVMDGFYSAENASNFQFEKLYLDSYTLEYTGIGATYPQATERLLNKWNEGTALINYIGHANPKSWGHEHLFTWTAINSMQNKRLPFIYAATCEFMRWDADEVSGAEVLWLMPSSGIIATICPSREVLISANGVLNASTARYFFETDKEGRPLSCGEIMRRGKNDSNTGTNKLRYGLMGDPSMRMPWPVLKVAVDEINGVNLEQSNDLPVLKAKSKAKVTGHIQDAEGNLIEDFNGIAEISLFDAEKVVTTNGNGSDGVKSTYNDRTTRLFVGRVKVANGKWSTEFTMPSEIENNYSPALLSMYAFEENGRDANGSCEKLYAYGYDENAPDDFEGPKIIEFYLDSPSFVSGNQVSPNPTLMAKFYDESGISVSEAGIGHNITLELDGTHFFDDVAQYYVPDENQSGGGSLTYALNNISQGNHSLRLIVWDNANNSTTATLEFSISALWKPTISTLTTDVNPATSSVNFIVATDGASSSMECTIEVYDIWGRRVWRDKAPSFNGATSKTTLGWDLNDFGGGRVAGGVYIYKAIIKTENGATVSKSKKLIVKGV